MVLIASRSDSSAESFDLNPSFVNCRQSSLSVPVSAQKALPHQEHDGGVVMSPEERRLRKLTVPQLKELIAEKGYATSDLKSKPLKQDLLNFILECQEEELIQELDDIVDEQKGAILSSPPLQPPFPATQPQSRARNPIDLPDLKSKLLKAGIDSLQNFQLTVNQRVQEGSDVVLQAPTGSGKTLAYVVPYLAKYADEITSKSTKYGWTGKVNDRKIFIAKPRILVLAPSRELAQQIGSVWKSFGASAVSTFGGVPIERHISLLAKEAPYVLISTPGRLRELCRKNFVQFDRMNALILDEADVLLDANDSTDVLQIVDDIGAAKTEYQLILASATYNEHSKSFLREMEVPTSAMVKVEGDVATTSDGNYEIKPARPPVEHWHCACATSARSKVAASFLEIYNPSLAIIFVAKKSDTEDVGEYLSCMAGDRNVQVLHGDMTQSQRSRTISFISSGKVNKPIVLVATDVASRGLDLPSVDMVIQFGIPTMAGKENTYNPDLYIHRTGRAGRMGHTTKIKRHPSQAILLYDPAQGEGKLLSNLVADVERTLLQNVMTTINPIRIPSSNMVASTKFERALQSIEILQGNTAESKVQKEKLDLWETRLLQYLGEEVANNPKELRRYLARSLIQHAGLAQKDTAFQDYSLLTGSTTERTLVFRYRGASPSPLVPSDVTSACKSLGSGKLGRVSISRGEPPMAIFDLPKKRATKLVAAARENSDFIVEFAAQLPEDLP